MNYWLHPEAEAELGEAAEYYAAKASPLVAAAYVREFERVLAIVLSNQRLGTPTVGNLRKYPFRRFPYAIMYREDTLGGPQIYAVAHQSRKPVYWNERTD